MDYARGDARVFVAKGEIKTKRKDSPEAASRRAYVASHTFTVETDPVTKEKWLKAVPKNEK